ncbi:hypothetical protein E1L24_23400 [Salmonella enterica subsp. enterica serovar Braenderup]|nr:hypothetical protein [Salmonella enterica subsp. enterica serovar Braenderup]
MAKSTKQQIIDLINLKNPELRNPLTLEDVDFGEGVSSYQPSASDDTRNAKVTLTAQETSLNFTGSKEFHYTRIAANRVLGSQTYDVSSAEELNKEDAEILVILNEVINRLGWVDDEFAEGEVTISKGAVNETSAQYNFNIQGGNFKFLAGNMGSITLQVVTAVDMATLDGELDAFTV